MFMKGRSPVRRAAKATIAFVLLLVLAHAAAAQVWQIHQGQKLSVSQTSSAPLRVKSQGLASLRSYSFVGAVGGVNFEQTAAPAVGYSYQKLTLAYEPSKADGQRLAIVVDDVPIEVSLPDWQLIPIAKFADSEYTGLVSLFGEGPDRDNYYYIQYHEAVQDTLLGMRLLQADILLIDLRNHWDLPRQDDRLVLGAGESPPEMETSRTAMNRLQGILEKHRWRSWVLTDTATEPRFASDTGGFQVTASPYFYFWDFAQSSLDRERARQSYRSEFTAYDALVSTYNSKVTLYNSTADSLLRGRLQQELPSLRAQIESKERGIKLMQKQLENPDVEEVVALTMSMRSNADLLREYNPNVYQAYVNTAAYAAFFQFVQTEHPDSWKRFLTAIADVEVSPEVKTPTTWRKR